MTCSDEARGLIDALLLKTDKLVCHGVAGADHRTISVASHDRDAARQALTDYIAKLEAERDELQERIGGSEIRRLRRRYTFWKH